MQLITTVVCVVFVILSPVYAMAYVGPGLGAGTIGVILGIVGSLFIALFAIIWYPLKRLFKKKKESKHQDGNK
jgi:preprotein translocase subunit SecF